MSTTIAAELHEHQGESCAEQRLKVLRAELVRPIITVQSAVSPLKQIDPQVVKGLPENISRVEFENVINWLAEAGADLDEILQALTKDCSEPEALSHN
jgi:hypothetical protein